MAMRSSRSPAMVRVILEEQDLPRKDALGPRPRRVKTMLRLQIKPRTVDPGLDLDHRLQDQDLDLQVLVPNHDLCQEVDRGLDQLVQDLGKIFNPYAHQFFFVVQ